MIFFLKKMEMEKVERIMKIKISNPLLSCIKYIPDISSFLFKTKNLLSSFSNPAGLLLFIPLSIYILSPEFYHWNITKMKKSKSLQILQLSMA